MVPERVPIILETPVNEPDPGLELKRARAALPEGGAASDGRGTPDTTSTRPESIYSQPKRRM